MSTKLETLYARRDEACDANNDALFVELDNQIKREIVNAGVPETRGSSNQTAEDRAFSDYLRTGRAGDELRAAQAEATGGTGGYLVAPGFWNELSVALKMFGGMSQFYQQHDTDTGNPTPWPSNDPVNTVGSYITENAQVQDQDYVFGQGMMYAWTVTSGVIKASLQLLQDSSTSVDSFVAARVGESIGRKIAIEVMNGAGPDSKAATGIIPSLESFGSGNSSGGYVELGTATAVKMFSGDSTELESNVLSPATVFAAQAQVDPAYWPGSAWYMNARQALGMRQITDDNGRPLLNLDNAFADGSIGSIGGFPVRVVQEVPDLSASAVGGPIFGNLSHAMVYRNVAGAATLSLSERYADLLQHAWIGFQRFDSQPNDLRAAVTVKPASS